jgi:hypothetical protein
MVDRRRYTGTKTLQAGWTLLLLAVGLLVEATGLLPTVATVGGIGLLWVGGLVVLGRREHRHWTELIAESSFDRGTTGGTADLQRIIQGKSVTVTTDVTGILTPSHTQVRAPVEGIDASFTVRIADEELTDRDGLRTGVDALDERFAFTGAEGNVAALLTEEVRDALLAVGPPGTYTITPDSIVYEVPFTRLTADELAAAGHAVAVLALQLEAAGQQ